MRSVVVVPLIILMVSLGIMGCVKPDADLNSPVGAIPKIIIDHVDDKTKVDVRGLDDYRYDRITIRAFNDDIVFLNNTEDNVFTQHVSFEVGEYTLNITVHDKKKVYSFEGNFTIYPADEPDVVMLITTVTDQGETKERRIRLNDLPWRTLAERIE